MFCPECGKEVTGDKLFCTNCGNKMIVQPIIPVETQPIYPEVAPIENSVVQTSAPTPKSKGVSPLAIAIPLLVLLVIGCIITAYIVIKASYSTPVTSQNTSKVADNKSATNKPDSSVSSDTKPSTSTDTSTTSSTSTANLSSEYIFPDSDKAYLGDSDLRPLLNTDKLALARNEIYARHGYVFTTQPFVDYFKSKSWYKPNPAFKGGDANLNKFEAANVAIIKQFEAGDIVKVTSQEQALKILQNKFKADTHIRFSPMQENSFGASYYGFGRTYVEDDGTIDEGDIGSLIFVERKTGDLYVLDLQKDPKGNTLKKYVP